MRPTAAAIYAAAELPLCLPLIWAGPGAWLPAAGPGLRSQVEPAAGWPRRPDGSQAFTRTSPRMRRSRRTARGRIPHSPVNGSGDFPEAAVGDAQAHADEPGHDARDQEDA